jgi:hypothetical protein
VGPGFFLLPPGIPQLIEVVAFGAGEVAACFFAAAAVI